MKRAFALLLAGFVSTAWCAPAPTPSVPARCWTNRSAETYFPADDPFFIGERVLLLRRGTVRYDLYLPTDYDAHLSQRYPLAVVAASLEPEERQALADVFCARGWVLLTPILPAPLSEEKTLAALICTYRSALKDGRILPGVQLLAGYGVGAEIGAVFAAARPAFAAWIGDETPGRPWFIAPLANRPDLLLYLLARQSEEADLSWFIETLPEETTLRTESIAPEAPPLAPEAMARALDWIREQLLFVRPAEGRFYEYAQMEYDRLSTCLPQADGTECERIEQERTALLERFHLHEPILGVSP
ncbi:MAG: hypothetical protein PHP44_05505 [Kiritimatiellae bacterium]|nr:hypothetical protein [Kiritimatiellia bacterium]MDD4735544.1 hypothetical protein [Kiritimatiellia bacterium]